MSEHKNIVEQTFSAAVEIQDVFNRAQREQEESGAVTPETQAAIDQLAKERGHLRTELGKWFLWTESRLDALKAQYKAIYEKMESDETVITNKLLFIEKCIKQIFEPGPDSIFANESIYAYYRENERLEIAEGTAVPIEFCENVLVPEKKLIKAALEAGDEIEGCRIVKSYSLSLKHGGEKAIKNAQKLMKGREAKANE